MAKEQDQSMEEILQSIKRIIAEEGEATPSGSDVLELTEMVEQKPQEAAAPAIPSMSIEEIMAQPVASEIKAETKPMPTPPPAPPAPKPAAAPTDEGLASKETIAASAAKLDALKNIPDPMLPPMAPSGLGFRNGTSIEDLVLESLKPMLKEWLDTNLPGMVERLVEKEIRKLSSRG